MAARNVLGTDLEPCSYDPLTGFTRNGCCDSFAGDAGVHLVCAEMTEQFLAFSKDVGNDLSTPRPEFRFPGLSPGDRWCVTAANWFRAYQDSCAAPVVLASTHARTLDVVPLAALKEHAVDVPDDLADL